MNMKVEFNSVEEIKEFISLFGGAALAEACAEVKPVNSKDVREVKEEPRPITPKKEEKPNTEANSITEEPKKEDKEEPTKEDVKAAFKKLVAQGKNATAKNIMNKYGANKVSELDAKDYAAAIDDINTALGE